MEDSTARRNREQDELENKFLVIPMKIMADERLTLADKNVYGRAFFFEEYFEAPSRTAKLLGISENQVKISKRKLEQLGLLLCIGNDGRGKRYIAIMPSQQGRVSESDTQRIRICHSENQNLTTENKAENKDEISSKEDATSANDEPLKEDQSKPAIYGKPEINEILDDWEEATGFDWHGVRQERFAVKNLIAKHGHEATKALVMRVKAARRSDDQFAPQIAKPSQLVGKYEKLTALTMWEERNAKAEAKDQESTGPDFRALYPAMEYDPCEDIPDTPEAKAERHRIAQELRKKLGFNKENN